MTLQEIRSSGLLELYVLGEISIEDKSLVENSLQKFPELQKDLDEIALALESYAHMSGVKPSSNLKQEIMDSIRSSSSNTEDKTNSSKPTYTRAWLYILGALFLGSLFWGLTQNRNGKKYKSLYDEAVENCDSIQKAQLEEIKRLGVLEDSGNQLFAFTATDNYPSTDIHLFLNKDKNTNYLQINNLPPIDESQSYQLWSLKEGQNPIPLTVFELNEGWVALDYEANTQTYAITIENRGGASSPNLNQLIATATL